MLNPSGIARVGLYANDLRQLASFNQDKLGLRLIEHGESRCIFEAGAGALFEMWGTGRASPQPESQTAPIRPRPR
jgi:catechol-2,3-dioxygenase